MDWLLQAGGSTLKAQTLESEPQTAPTGHWKQGLQKHAAVPLIDPVVSVTAPGGHGRQSERDCPPIDGLNVPTGQARQRYEPVKTPPIKTSANERHIDETLSKRHGQDHTNENEG
eukprot:2230122-Rhodomonas_salina.2